MEIDESNAVTMFNSIPNQPINPKVQHTAKSKGKLPNNPADRLLNIILSKITMAKNANNKE